MDNAVGQTESVDQKEYRAKDQKRVVLIYVLSVVAAAIVAFAAVFFESVL